MQCKDSMVGQRTRASYRTFGAVMRLFGPRRPKVPRIEASCGRPHAFTYGSRLETSDADGDNSKRRRMMQDQPVPLTMGVDHIGLSVGNLDLSKRFFCDCLGFRVVGERPSHPAIFVSDGHVTVTLWQVEAPDQCSGFDRRRNVGLHHLALKVANPASLEALHARVKAWPGAAVEFAPQPTGAAPKAHFVVHEPGGIRLEFDCDPVSQQA
jgi:catechol 2,3-dioxygenase-like lactoylglutathione lyase family enzyme